VEGETKLREGTAGRVYRSIGKKREGKRGGDQKNVFCENKEQHHGASKERNPSTSVKSLDEQTIESGGQSRKG